MEWKEISFVLFVSQSKRTPTGKKVIPAERVLHKKYDSKRGGWEQLWRDFVAAGSHRRIPWLIRKFLSSTS
jgi:hypothetical protein